ncbi:glutathione S-transferase family protein [Actibacterium ureilyticum]|uniref:glutathione S-transferase family protein n=1 Tax=Actibacterium ureilyticum TaxID=1590614 RepID=UPI000BAABB1D|nr:glutathione S-transferase family protein [Actibacterium ureilyticum]
MIRLHHCHESRSMRVLWLLHELGVPFELKVYPFDATLRQPDFLALSPAGRVPALEIDGDVMFESGAMIEYLCERFPQAGLGRAPGDPARRAWLSWLHFAETLSQHSAALNQQHEVLYEDHMRSPVIMKIEVKRLEKCYAALEARLQDSAHLADDRFSAADVAVGQAMYMALHFARADAFPALQAWYGQITARPGLQASLPGPRDDKLFSRDFYAPWPMPERE